VRASPAPAPAPQAATGDLFGEPPPQPRGRRGAARTETAPAAESSPPGVPPAGAPCLRTIKDAPNDYRIARTPEERHALLEELRRRKAFAFTVQTDGTDPKIARLAGIAFSFAEGRGTFVPFTEERLVEP